MAVTEEHWIGFDPTLGPPREPGCPLYKIGATIIWYEHYAFFGWSFKIIGDTGITYNICYATFDTLGNLISTDDLYGLGCCGAAMNSTCRGTEKCPTNDEWLRRARDACDSRNKPSPGTIAIAPSMSMAIGIAA